MKSGKKTCNKDKERKWKRGQTEGGKDEKIREQEKENIRSGKFCNKDEGTTWKKSKKKKRKGGGMEKSKIGKYQKSQNYISLKCKC